MKILVTGYYGKRNAGDDLLQQAIAELFSPHRMLFTSWFPELDTLRAADAIVVGGGSIWPGNTFFAFGDRLPKDIGKPIIVIGISARSPSEKTLEKTRSLIRQTRFFHVRDRQTYEYFGDCEKTRCGPDLFWWSPFGVEDCSDARSFEDVSINLREWAELPWSPTAVVETSSGFGRRLKAWPLHYGAPEPPNSYRNDHDFMRALGLPAHCASFDWSSILASRYVIAMRFHAVQIAVRLERPVVGFDYHPKIRAFFDESDLAELCVPLGDISALETAIQRLESQFDEYREKFITLKHRLLNEAEALRHDLRAEVDRIAAETQTPSNNRNPIRALKSFARRLSLH